MHSIPREGLASETIDRFALRVAEGSVREQFKGNLMLPNNMDSLRNYFAQVTLVDHGVGKILAALGRLNLEASTIVIYTADHGFSLGHNGLWGHGTAAFPASAHRPSYNIPLIMGGGPIVRGTVSDDLVSQIDLFPTLANMVGATEAQKSLPSKTKDLGPMLAGQSMPETDAVFFDQEETRAIRTRDWLYAMRFKGSKSYPFADEMYRLSDDPAEKINLVDDPIHAAIAAELRSRITIHFDEIASPEYDLWKGGTAKSNVAYAKLWQDAWGQEWTPKFSS